MERDSYDKIIVFGGFRKFEKAKRQSGAEGTSF